VRGGKGPVIDWRDTDGDGGGDDDDDNDDDDDDDDDDDGDVQQIGRLRRYNLKLSH
jgi:hypothetical protein